MQPRAKAQTLRLLVEPLFLSLYFDIPPYFLIRFLRNVLILVVNETVSSFLTE